MYNTHLLTINATIERHNICTVWEYGINKIVKRFFSTRGDRNGAHIFCI